MSKDLDTPKTDTSRLVKLREPFPAHQISKLPKPYKKDSPKGQCKECGGYHGLPAVHLDYVGHAALTDRLLDTDPAWSWEPLALKDGLPSFDASGGLWIKLTVCGVTRLGYGNAENKGYMDAGAREKEVIGDALRNAAMRFGAALDLWHKGELHVESVDKSTGEIKKEKAPIQPSDALDDEAKEGAQEAADKVVRLWGEGKEIAAYEVLYESGFDNEMFLAIWGLLRPHSAIRTAIKKMRAENGKVAA